MQDKKEVKNFFITLVIVNVDFLVHKQKAVYFCQNIFSLINLCNG